MRKAVYAIVIPHQMPSSLCMSRDISVIPTQQQNPIKIGLPPFFTSFTISVCRPTAPIAIMIKNLLSSFKGRKISGDICNTFVETVVMTEAIRK